MTAPKRCDECGTCHHSYQGHVFARAASRVTTAINKAPLVVDIAAGGNGAVVDAPSARARDRHRKTAERREYLRLKQRETRARRSAGKAS